MSDANPVPIFGLREAAPRELAHPWPRITGPMRKLVQRHLDAGCYCDAKTARLTRRVINERVTVHLQCDGCGRSLGGGLKRDQHYNWQDYPEWDQGLIEQREAERLSEFEAHRQLQPSREALSAEYLTWCKTSPEWHGLRHKVMQRAGFVCEACLERPAFTAHHLTYRHGKLPPAWELRAVCEDCHRRLHAHHYGLSDEWAA